MKVLSVNIIVLLIILGGNFIPSEKMTIQTTPCPPYHEDTSKILKELLTEEEFADKRQELGIPNIQMNEIDYLKNKTDKAACRELQEVYEWPLENHHRVYFKNDDYYFVLDKLKTTRIEEGKVHIRTGGYNTITVLDKEFERLGRVSL